MIAILACILICTFGPSVGDLTADGTLAEDGQFPNVVSMRYDDKHICAGSILDEETILTAARCIEEFAKMRLSEGRIKIVTGSNSLKDGDVYEVKSYEIHKDYKAIHMHHNIALIKVKKPIQFYEFVRPVKLRKNYMGAGRGCRLIGWGQSSYKGATQDKLQFIDMETIDIENCGSIPSKLDSQICAFTQKKEGACQGDFGSPLIDQNGEQFGFYSSGEPHNKRQPDVFIRVHNYLDWIRKFAKI